MLLIEAAVSTPQQQSQKTQQKQLQTVAITASAGIAQDLAKKHAISTAMREGGTSAAIARDFTTGTFIGEIINVVGNLALAATSFLSTKKRAKKREKLSAAQAQAQSYLDEVLSAIQTTGVQLVSRGFVPHTKQFEEALKKSLYDKYGYQGRCNATIWEPATIGTKKQIWATFSNDGYYAKPGTLQTPPPNLSSYWYARCKNTYDLWDQEYQNKLLIEGRIKELEEFKAAYKTGNITVRALFGLMTAGLVLIFIINALRIKK